MTEVEMMAEIERLKRENSRLRAETGVRPQRDTFPDEILAKYEPLRGILWDNNRVTYRRKQYTIRKAFSTDLSRIIRAALFPKTTGEGKDRYLTCQQMTDEQYQQFVATLDDVLKALSKHREQVEFEEA